MITLKHNHFTNNLSYIILTIIVFSIGIKIGESRFGVRIDQLFAIFVSLFGFFLVFQRTVNKYLFIWFIFVFIFLPIFIYITNSFGAINQLQAWFRILGFLLLGYFLFNNNYTRYFKVLQILILIVLAISFGQIFQIIPGEVFMTLYPGQGAEHNYFKLPSATFGLSEYTSSFLTFGFVYYMLKYFGKYNYQRFTFFKGIFFLSIFMLFYSKSDAHSVFLMAVYFFVFYIFIRKSQREKKIFFNTSILFLIVGGVGVVLELEYLTNYFAEGSSESVIFNSLHYRLAETWYRPVIEWLSSFDTFLFGMGMSVAYADSGYFAFIGNYGLIGIVLMYLPIFLFLLKLEKLKEKNIYLDTFFYTSLVLLAANLTYPLFIGGKFSDVYWLTFGMIIRYYQSLKLQGKI